MDTNKKFIEYISPSSASKKLGIAPTTLRKYSNIIEKTSNNSNFFERDSNNGRLYSRDDMSVLKRAVSLKKRPDLSLKDALNQALEESDVSSVSDTDTRLTGDMNTNLKLNADDKLRQYEILINQLVKSNLELSSQLETAIEKLDNYNEKLTEIEQGTKKGKGFFSRLFEK